MQLFQRGNAVAQTGPQRLRRFELHSLHVEVKIAELRVALNLLRLGRGPADRNGPRDIGAALEGPGSEQSNRIGDVELAECQLGLRLIVAGQRRLPACVHLRTDQG